MTTARGNVLFDSIDFGCLRTSAERTLFLRRRSGRNMTQICSNLYLKLEKIMREPKQKQQDLTTYMADERCCSHFLPLVPSGSGWSGSRVGMEHVRNPGCLGSWLYRHPLLPNVLPEKEERVLNLPLGKVVLVFRMSM